MDAKGFMRAKLNRRTKFVHVLELADWFGEEIAAAEAAWREEHPDREPTDVDRRLLREGCVGFLLQGLTGPELSGARKAAAERRNFVALAEGILSGMPAEVLDSVRQLYGADPDVTEEDALHIHVLCRAIVTPALPADQRLEVVRRIYQCWPIDFRHLANEALILTGRGHEPGKPVASSRTSA